MHQGSHNAKHILNLKRHLLRGSMRISQGKTQPVALTELITGKEDHSGELLELPAQLRIKRRIQPRLYPEG